MKYFLSKVPIPTAAVSLGLAALGNLLQSISESLRTFCGILSFLLLLLVIAKIIFCPSVVREEFKNPVISSVSATFFMATMQLTTYVYKSLGMVAFIIWLLAVIGHISLIVYYTKRMISNFSLQEIFPTCFVTYVGIIVASITSVSFRMQTLGRIIFAFGLASYIVIFVLVTYRYLKHEVHESFKPLFCIYTAPMSLTIAGYVSVFEEKSLMFMFVCECLAQILYLVVLSQLPKLLKSKFYPSFAAFTFPFVITVTALKQVASHIGAMYPLPVWISHVITIETIIAVAMVSFTVVHYVIYLYTHLPFHKSRKAS